MLNELVEFLPEQDVQVIERFGYASVGAFSRDSRGGNFFDPVGRNHTHDVGGDVLLEAKKTVESEEYQQLHRRKFEHLDVVC